VRSSNRGYQTQDPESERQRKDRQGILPRDPLVRASLIGFLTLSMLVVGVFSYFYVKYDRVIEKRFSSPVSAIPPEFTPFRESCGLAKKPNPAPWRPN